MDGITDEEYDKAIGQFRLQLNAVFRPFHMYGQDVYVVSAQDAIVNLALRLHHRLSGVDVPIVLEEHYLPDD